MEKILYIVSIAVVVVSVCLIFVLLNRRNKKLSQNLILKSKPPKQVVAEEKQESQAEPQKGLEHAHLEKFVLEEEKTQEASVEEEFDYKKFVDQNIEALGKYGKDFDEIEDLEENENNSKDILQSILFGSKNSDED